MTPAAAQKIAETVHELEGAFALPAASAEVLTRFGHDGFPLGHEVRVTFVPAPRTKGGAIVGPPSSPRGRSTLDLPPGSCADPAPAEGDLPGRVLAEVRRGDGRLLTREELARAVGVDPQSPALAAALLALSDGGLIAADHRGPTTLYGPPADPVAQPH